jgi:hypothetical protein
MLTISADPGPTALIECGVRVSNSAASPVSSTSSVPTYKVTYPPVDDAPAARVHDGFEWFYVLSGRVRLVLGERELVALARAAGVQPLAVRVEDADDLGGPRTDRADRVRRARVELGSLACLEHCTPAARANAWRVEASANEDLGQGVEVAVLVEIGQQGSPTGRPRIPTARAPIRLRGARAWRPSSCQRLPASSCRRSAAADRTPPPRGRGSRRRRQPRPTAAESRR